MRIQIIASFLLISLALAGCISAPAEGSPGTAPAQPGAGSEQLEEAGAGNPGQAEEPADAPANASSGMPGTATPPEPGYEYEGRTFGELAQMGIPLECDIKHVYAGKDVVSRAYMNGSGELRVESPVGISQCKKTVSVARSGRVYISCEEKQVMASCDWIREDYDTPGRSSAFDYTALEPGSIRCRGWIYDKESFQTPGDACRLG